MVEFASRSDMKNAISKLDGTELNGRKLKIFEDSRRWVVFTILHTPKAPTESDQICSSVVPYVMKLNNTNRIK